MCSADNYLLTNVCIQEDEFDVEGRLRSPLSRRIGMRRIFIVGSLK